MLHALIASHVVVFLLNVTIEFVPLDGNKCLSLFVIMSNGAFDDPTNLSAKDLIDGCTFA